MTVTGLDFLKHRTPRRRGTLALFLAGLPLVTVAFLVPTVPFWSAILPLAAGIAIGTPRARGAAMAAYFLPAALICAWGFIGIGMPPAVVWQAAILIVAVLAGTASLIGITAATILMTAIPVFPASPILPFADALPAFGLPGLAAALGFTAVAEYRRGWLTASGVIGLAIMGSLSLLSAQSSNRFFLQDAPVWVEKRAPVALTEWTRWIALRDSLEPGAVAVLGENVFEAGNVLALRFWCRAAETRNLTLYIGVAEPFGRATRGAVWRIDQDTCQDRTRSLAVYRAQYGIPEVTGTWGRMPAFHDDGAAPGDVLICLEAFLPWSWVPLLWREATPSKPVVVLSNDTAFGSIPVHVLRRKSAQAMADLVSRPMHHAETGQTMLVKMEFREWRAP